MKSSKTKVQIAGVTYEIPSKSLRTTDYWGKPITPKIYGNAPTAGAIVKQYVKKKFPNVEVSVKSASFANGNSLDVNLWMSDGSSVEEGIYRDVSGFAHLFEYGKYNGMHDIYEDYESSGLRSDNGTEIEAGVKYVSVRNEPKCGSPAYFANSIKAMMRGEYVFGVVTKEEAAHRMARFGYKMAEIEKGLALVG
jgi:hypothetical protein